MDFTTLLQLRNICAVVYTLSLCSLAFVQVAGGDVVYAGCGGCGDSEGRCRLMRGRFVESDLAGSTRYVDVTKIPVGACNVNITELQYSSNYLALKAEQSSQYIINGNWEISNSGDYRAAGTTFIYRRPTNRYKPFREHVIAAGPTTESVAVSVLYKQPNPGVQYEYKLTLDSRHVDPPRSQWQPVESNPVRPVIPVRPVNPVKTIKPVVRPEPSSERPYPDEKKINSEYWDRRSKPVVIANYPRVEVGKKPVAAPTQDPRSLGRPNYGSLPQTEGRQYEVSAEIVPVPDPDWDSPSRSDSRTRTSQGGGDRKFVSSQDTSGRKRLLSRLTTTYYGVDGRGVSTDNQGSRGTSRVSVTGNTGSTGTATGSTWRGTASTGNTGSTWNSAGNYGRNSKTYTGPATSYGGSGRTGEPYNTGNGYGGNSGYNPERYGSQYPSDYEWRVNGFTACTRSCGGGLQTSRIMCIVRRSQAIVTDENCDPSRKPGPQTVVCNNVMCPARWSVGSWSACSVTCGQGSKRRLVECRQTGPNNADVSVSASRCLSLPKPAIVENCELKQCYTWRIGPWGQCTVDCGRGSQRRDAYCQNYVGRKVPDSLCTGAGLREPARGQVCQRGPCTTGWMYSQWSDKCEGECGSGQYRRHVVCASRSGCKEGERPLATKSCNNARGTGRQALCGGQWLTGPWSGCSDDCEKSSRTRTVLCVVSRDEGGTQTGQVVDQAYCGGSERPDHKEACPETACTARWYTTDWGQCSASCGDEAFQSRIVQCLTRDQKTADTCDPGRRPPNSQPCNRQPCPVLARLDPGCRDLMSSCRLVVRARLCAYKYYSSRCCSSCTRHEEQKRRHKVRHSGKH